MEQLRQVEIKQPSRNIFAKGETREMPPRTVYGAFHCWEHHKDGEENSRVYAIVELEDGNVGRYEIDTIKFTGKPAGANMYEYGELTPE